MILNQWASQIQRAYQVSTKRQFIQQILLIFYHSQMLNNRYARIFYKYFGGLAYPETYDQSNARDKLILANQQEQMKKFYKMKEIVSTIRDSVLTRIKADRIAPIFVCSSAEYQIMNIIQRRNRAGFTQLPESNTMHTESSSKHAKFKNTKVQNTILPKLLESNKNYPKHTDTSSQTMNRITQDLSNMIRNAFDYQQKSIYSKLLFPKNVINKSDSLKKHFKRKLLQQNISIIKMNNNYQIQVSNFEQPQQNYGLRKVRRKNVKSIEMKSKLKKHHHSSSQVKRSKSKRKISQAANKKESFQRLHLSPLTPNPFRSSKFAQGWNDNKSSRFSLKSNLSRALQKSKSGKIQKLQKSPMILKKLSPKARLVQQKPVKGVKKIQR